MSQKKSGPAGNGAALKNTAADAELSRPRPDAHADLLPVSDALDPAHTVVAAAMRSTATQVLALPIEAGDLTGYSTIWQAVLEVCASGANPDPTLVLDRLATAGDPHAHNRLIRAATATAWPEALRQYASAALAARYRDEFRSLAVSLTAATETAPEADLEQALSGHRQTLLGIRGRLVALRGEGA